MRFGTLCVAAGLVGCAHGSTGATVDASDSGSGSNQPDGSVPPGDAGCNGLPCNAIYVAPTGADTNTGIQSAPLRTIGAAITRATKSTPALPIYVQAGKYSEKVTVVGGIEIHGGYDTSWAKVQTAISEIDGPVPAVVFDQIKAATLLDTFTIKSADAMGTGASSMAVVITSSSMITLQGVIVVPGVGAAGGDGTNGATGAGGGNGGNGLAGVETSTAFLCDGTPLEGVGAAGTSSCGHPGGVGGAPGNGGGNGGTGGDGTVNAQSGGFGGINSVGPGICTTGTRTSGDGQPGADGPNGSAGGNGSPGASQGAFTKAVYVPSNGGNGASGTPGQGGGGGGGGGGGTSGCDSSGSSGGGGGGGGCGGTGGIAGSGGGGSFGIVVVDSSVIISSSTIMANHGGAGGRGGNGGGGGGGGNGGAGGPYSDSSTQDDGGCGDAGGHGGSGGAGGAGGGGGGGPSAAVVCVGTTSVSIPSTALTSGIAGSGGASAGSPGAAGVSTKSIGCSFF